MIVFVTWIYISDFPIPACLWNINRDKANLIKIKNGTVRSWHSKLKASLIARGEGNPTRTPKPTIPGRRPPFTLCPPRVDPVHGTPIGESQISRQKLKQFYNLRKFQAWNMRTPNCLHRMETWHFASIYTIIGNFQWVNFSVHLFRWVSNSCPKSKTAVQPSWNFRRRL